MAPPDLSFRSSTCCKDESFVLAVDQGTTSTRVIIFNRQAKPVAIHQMDIKQIYRHPGWVEHDPMNILESVETCISEAVKQFKESYQMSQIKAMSITNQRETTVLWNKNTGKVLYNAIVWSDARTSETVKALKAKPGADEIQVKTGLPISTFFSAVKIRWILDHIPSVKKAYDDGVLAFGTIDSWLVYNLTDRQLHITDTTNSSRTLLSNIKTLNYDQSLLEFFDLSKLTLPKICSSSEHYALVANGPLKGIPICGILGDQSASLVGHGALFPGQAKNTYGTGSFVLLNTGEEPVVSTKGLLTTCAYQFKGEPPMYALEGSISSCGSAVTWLRDQLKLIKNYQEVDELAQSVTDSAGVVFVTAFSGLFAPYWIDDARGSLFGMTAYTTQAHIVRATLEATCFQTRAVLDAMAIDANLELKTLRVDGGLTNSDVCMQTQADVLGFNVSRPAMREITALGSAFMAGLAAGVWASKKEICSLNQDDSATFTPKHDEKLRSENYNRWNRAVKRAKGWITEYTDINE